jgi:geranylgeranyl transferase type-2 subunit alpha
MLNIGTNLYLANLELDLVKAAIYTDPADQSAWLYYWWLLGRAPDEVTLSGAYQLKDTPLVILGFNDVIKFMQLPQLLDVNNQCLSGKLYPLNQENSECSSIWVFLLDNDTSAKTVTIQSETILPSTASKSIPSNKTWELNVQQITRGQGAYERVESIKTNLKKSWTPLSTKMYKDPTLNDQTAWFTLDKAQLLKDEIETVRELLELEPDSACKV